MSWTRTHDTPSKRKYWSSGKSCCIRGGKGERWGYGVCPRGQAYLIHQPFQAEHRAQAFNYRVQMLRKQRLDLLVAHNATHQIATPVDNTR